MALPVSYGGIGNGHRSLRYMTIITIDVCSNIIVMTGFCPCRWLIVFVTFAGNTSEAKKEILYMFERTGILNEGQ
jgi:hypothetical protein